MVTHVPNSDPESGGPKGKTETRRDPELKTDYRVKIHSMERLGITRRDLLTFFVRRTTDSVLLVSEYF